MGNEWACDRIEELEAEAAELRATIARMDATIRFLRDQYRTAVGLPTVPPEGTCPTCGQPTPAPP